MSENTTAVLTRTEPGLRRRLDETVGPRLRALEAVIGGTAATSTPDREYRFAREYRHYASGYPRIVSAALIALEDETARLPLVRNLWEEHGEGDLSVAHRLLMDAWVDSLAPHGSGSAVAPLPSTVRATQLLDAAADGTAAFQYGVVLGLEWTNTAQLGALLPTLRVTFSEESADRRYIVIHAEDDVQHAADLLAAAESCFTREHEIEAVLAGVVASIEADEHFWAGVSRFVF
jgi:hypothetical protein